LEEKRQPTFLFSTVGVKEQHIFIVNTLIFSKQVQYSLRDEDFDYIHEMEDMEDSSEGEESIDGDDFED
jgi:hypothetical protein